MANTANQRSRKWATAKAPENRRARRWASKQETADYAHVVPRTIDRWAEAGKITAYRAGPKLVRFDLDELDALFTPIPNGRVGA